MERDHVCMGIFKILEISTHTLTWSVTGSLFKLQDVRCNFNSHAHVERDHFRWCENCKQLHFNSHAHVERDRKMRTFQYQMQISTHTLTWSVTLVHECITGKKHISTHTLTWSVTFRCLGFWGGLFISTHTLTWSVTCVVQISVAVQKFQLTRSRGAWHL